MALSASARAAVVLLATLVGVAITAGLGAWQLSRAAQKTAMYSALDSRARMPVLSAADLQLSTRDAEPLHHRAVRLRGRWVSEHSVFLENRQMRGRVGFYLVTPLQLEGRSHAVLVQRGWVPRDQRDRTLLPPVPTPTGTVEVVGHIAPPPARLYEFAAAASGLIRQNLDLAQFEAESGLRLAPLSVQQVDAPSTAGDGLTRQWLPATADVQKHYGYAFQWFALCGLMVGLYVWFKFVRPRLRRHARQ